MELKNGETYNGHLVNCDNWMNIQLREVICTSRVRQTLTVGEEEEGGGWGGGGGGQGSGEGEDGGRNGRRKRVGWGGRVVPVNMPPSNSPKPHLWNSYQDPIKILSHCNQCTRVYV